MQRTDKSKTNHMLCLNCGGALKWSIGRQTFECAACRTPGEIITLTDAVVEHDFEGYAARDSAEEAYPEAVVFACSICGAQVAFDKTQTATVCPMCSAPYVSQARQVAGVAPDGIIPFKVDKQQAQENFRKWVKSLWFAPNKLKQSYQQGKLEGMYLPFWTFDAQTEGRYSGQGGQTYTVKDKDGKEEVRVNWSPVFGEVEESFDDLLVCATEGRVKDIIASVGGYNTQEGSVPYSDAYLSGFAAERYAIRADTAADEARERIEQRMRSSAESHVMRKGYDQVRISRLDLQYRMFRYKHVLLPAWVSAFAYGGKQYLYMINGETGTVGGNRPYSVVKIASAVVAALLVLCGVIGVFSSKSEPDPSPALAASASQSASSVVVVQPAAVSSLEQSIEAAQMEQNTTQRL